MNQENEPEALSRPSTTDEEKRQLERELRALHDNDAKTPSDQSNAGCLWWILGIAAVMFVIWLFSDTSGPRRTVPDHIRDAPVGHNRGGDDW